MHLATVILMSQEGSHTMLHVPLTLKSIIPVSLNPSPNLKETIDAEEICLNELSVPSLISPRPEDSALKNLSGAK